MLRICSRNLDHALAESICPSRTFAKSSPHTTDQSGMVHFGNKSIGILKQDSVDFSGQSDMLPFGNRAASDHARLDGIASRLAWVVSHFHASRAKPHSELSSMSAPAKSEI